jgi:hypothetical protein
MHSTEIDGTEWFIHKRKDEHNGFIGVKQQSAIKGRVAALQHGLFEFHALSPGITELFNCALDGTDQLY